MNLLTIGVDELVIDLSPYLNGDKKTDTGVNELQSITDRHQSVLQSLTMQANKFNMANCDKQTTFKEEIKNTGLEIIFENRYRFWQITISPVQPVESDLKKGYLGSRPSLSQKIAGYSYFELHIDSDKLVSRIIRYDPGFRVRPKLSLEDLNDSAVTVIKERYIDGVYNQLQSKGLNFFTGNTKQLLIAHFDDAFNEDLLNACNYLLCTGLQTHSKKSLYAVEKDSFMVSDFIKTISNRATMFFVANKQQEESDTVMVETKNQLGYKDRSVGDTGQSMHINISALISLKDGKPFRLEHYNVNSSYGYSVYLPFN
jgi:hypothetical protein